MLIVEKEPKSIWAETYKSLRTNLQYLNLEIESKTILVTSSDDGEGKTTVSSNLAMVLAEDKEKVILIDCNLREPNIHNKFELKGEKGLTEFLLEKNKLEEVIHEQKNGLHVIVAGRIPYNPSEIIGSKAMNSLLKDLKDKYDYIILDSPAIHGFTDSKVLATKTDFVLLVARAEKTLKNSILDAKKELEKINANILGVVINDIPEAARNLYNMRINKKDDKKKGFSLISKLSFKRLNKKIKTADA
ncbi:CpsD/CapB family tyrosine-protein kinase [Clostridium tarantellae]|uniref:non-specific protein-tyrosine kinase n=1 Tax=Clostridium tarantellae TaxID=39493 RepID=A0A6I1MNU8_9CLOT|nr:CpsD/CapB family tyrosine-protein kinase [Clostridium tarantellae]MPQ44724.1 polysaccharide biosynthesis tyrosine autokinase [Clostridium tarantellae]